MNTPNPRNWLVCVAVAVAVGAAGVGRMHLAKCMLTVFPDASVLLGEAVMVP